MRRTNLLVLTCVIACCARRAPAGDDAAGARPVDADGLAFFEQEVRPVLEQNCFRCHGAGKLEGNLSLLGRESILKGGESGPAVTLDDPKASLLVEAINYASYEMPPTGKMSPANIRTLTKWVEQGLPMPDKVETAVKVHHVPEVNAETKAHWAFQPVQRPDVPAVGDAAWVANPVDAFILAKLEAAGLSPAPQADPRTLFRRLHYDLLGLPPSPESVERFVAASEQDAEAAWMEAIEELLKSPHYGEHWARYWLDLVRYAETNSFERDNPKPFVWRYRDYVIRSFNADKPYDQFLREQLAGDELDIVTKESIIATGYYRLGLWDDEPADPKLAFYDGLDDIAATTAQAFLGLTMNCARCHDHKLDPIPQQDYYRFAAFFRNVRHYGVRNDESVYAASVRSIATPEEEEAFAAEKQAWERCVAELRRELDRVEDAVRPQLQGGEIDDFKDDSQRLRVLRQHVGDLISREAYKRYETARREWESQRRHPVLSAEQALCVTENGRDVPATFVLLRGNPLSEGDEVRPGFPAVLDDPDPSIQQPASGESSGRRRALAEWIASPDNPLTARVMVNRLWQWHFGRGLVRSSNNFGLTADAPTHPELLDWLAAEFVARGWSLKQMHRLLLTSRTYRMASVGEESAVSSQLSVVSCQQSPAVATAGSNSHETPTSPGSEKSAARGEQEHATLNPQPSTINHQRSTARPSSLDPLNNLYWRFDPRRLRAEEIRDSILAVNGTLNLRTMYGPSIYPTLPAEVLAGQSKPGYGWETSPPEEQRRRSIYIHLKRSLQVPLLAAFDVADTDFTCPERFATTQPTQALGMLNSAFVNEQAAILADDVRRTHGDDPRAQVAEVLRRVTQRPPTDTEIARGLRLMEDLAARYALERGAALDSFCLVALNLNEFVYLD